MSNILYVLFIGIYRSRGVKEIIRGKSNNWSLCKEVCWERNILTILILPYCRGILWWRRGIQNKQHIHKHTNTDTHLTHCGMSNTGWLRNWFYFEMWKNHSQHTEAKLPGQMIMRQQFKRIRDILVQVERHDLRPNFMGAVWPCPAICYQINREPAPYQFITSNLFHAYSPPLLHFRHFYNKQYVSISFLHTTYV